MFDRDKSSLLEGNQREQMLFSSSLGLARPAARAMKNAVAHALLNLIDECL